jgi:hypothetical protein
MSPRPRILRHLALVSLAILGLAGCGGLTQPWIAPEVALTGLRVKEAGLDRQTLTLTLVVRNPNDRTLPIKAMTYRLKLEGQEIAQGGGALDRQIPAFGESMVDVDVTGSLFGLVGRLPALALKNAPLDWQISGTATLAGGLITLPYRYSGQIDAQKLLAEALAYGAR